MFDLNIVAVEFCSETGWEAVGHSLDAPKRIPVETWKIVRFGDGNSLVMFPVTGVVIPC